jgi:hypothetical protein
MLVVFGYRSACTTGSNNVRVTQPQLSSLMGESFDAVAPFQIAQAMYQV